MKEIDLSPNEYRDLGSEVRERYDAIRNTKPDYPQPPPKPVMPDIRWVKAKVVDGCAVIDDSERN